MKCTKCNSPMLRGVISQWLLLEARPDKKVEVIPEKGFVLERKEKIVDYFHYECRNEKCKALVGVKK